MVTKKETPSGKEKKKDEVPAAGDSAQPKKETKKTAPKKTSGTKKSKKASKSDAGLSIGIDVKLPEGTCTDKDCPFHGTLPVRGQILEGYVVSDKMQGTAVIKRDYMRKIQKYERLEKRSNKYLVHNPSCLGVVTGDNVKIMECRPLSKMVSFVIIEKM
ncbi:MAG: 30S ribosomal protein S17 [Thermoplasmata archaeon]|nr:30S ribosomal protein S17 [Thermoplasmata archaeon]